ncbi:MAG: hypothetical protein K2H35_07575 [Muribaculaceae bacterium]|nr:hypothetical protein [Muribaculaceae bacterium]
MSTNFEYDEEQAIRFIRNAVGQEVSDQYSDDELTMVIDIIWDYYERQGFLKLSSGKTKDEVLDEAALTAYVKKELDNDGQILMDPDDLSKIVNADLDYEESLEDA